MVIHIHVSDIFESVIEHLTEVHGESFGKYIKNKLPEDYVNVEDCLVEYIHDLLESVIEDEYCTCPFPDEETN